MIIDVSSHRGPDGKMYYPSYPWGIHLHQVGQEPTNGGPLSSDSAKTKQIAMEKAQSWCSKDGRSAEVFRRRDGKVSIRYWHDGSTMQYIEY